MKLTQLAAHPQLVRIELDDPEIRETYGDVLEFWIYDRQPIDNFIKIATTRGEDFGGMIHLINSLILDEDGTPILKDGLTLPSNIIIKVVNAVVDRLGK